METQYILKRLSTLVLNPFLIISAIFLLFLWYRTNRSATIEDKKYACTFFSATTHKEELIVCNNNQYVDFFTEKNNSSGTESSRLPKFTTNLKQDSVAIRIDSKLFRDASLHLSARLNPGWLIQWNNWGDLNIIGVPIFSFLFILLGFIFWKQNQVLKKEQEIKGWLIQEREKERLHISQLLHDGPIQELQALRMTVQGVVTEKDKLTKINLLQDQIETNLRNVCYELRPPSLGHFSLDKNLDMLIQKLQGEYPDVHFASELSIEEPVLPTQTKLVYYRTAQEGLRNALKHANPSQIKVKFECTPKFVTLTIYNDGSTFNVPDDWTEITRSGHFGMMDMQERANYVGAIFSINSKHSSGTTLKLHLKR